MLFLDKDEPASSTPLRTELAENDTWNLTLLYPTPEAWEEAFEKIRSEFQSILAYRGRLGESAVLLLEVLELEKTLDLQLERLGHYSMLRASENSSDNENLSRRGRLQNLWTADRRGAAFLVPGAGRHSRRNMDAIFANARVSPMAESTRTRAPDEAAHAIHGGRTAPGIGWQRPPRAQRDVFPANQRRHEIRHVARRERRRTTAYAE